jgi:hypothetical protein
MLQIQCEYPAIWVNIDYYDKPLLSAYVHVHQSPQTPTKPALITRNLPSQHKLMGPKSVSSIRPGGAPLLGKISCSTDQPAAKKAS